MSEFRVVGLAAEIEMSNKRGAFFRGHMRVENLPDELIAQARIVAAERLHAANNALTIAMTALRMISAKDTTQDIDGNNEGPMAKIADAALEAIEKVIR